MLQYEMNSQVLAEDHKTYEAKLLPGVDPSRKYLNLEFNIVTGRSMEEALVKLFPDVVQDCADCRGKSKWLEADAKGWKQTSSS
jgi:hypothetical protein